MSQDQFPPLRIREQDGSPNAIPVFEIIVSDGTLTNLGGGRVALATGAGAGSTGGGVNFTIPLIVSSGGTGTTATGSATTLVGVNSSGVIYDYYTLNASDNLTIARVGSGYFFSAVTNAGSATNTASLVQSSRTISTIYPLSGGGDLSVDRTHAIDTAFLINSGRTLTAANGLIGGGNLSADRVFGINTTGSGEGKILITSGGSTLGGVAWVDSSGAVTSIVYAATGNKYVVMDLAADLTGEFRLAQSGNSISITTAAGLLTINATTQNITGLQQSIAIPLITDSGGTGRTTIGSAHTLLGVNSSEASLTYYALLASNNSVVTKVGTALYITATTADISGKQNSLTIPLIVGSGGTGQTTLTTRGMLIGSGVNAIQSLAALNSGGLYVGSNTLTAPVILTVAAGSQGFMLTTNSSTVTGLAWMATGGGGGTTFAIPLIVGSGGTGNTTLTNRGVLIGSGVNAVQALVALNSGEMLIGSSTVTAPQILALGAGSQGYILTANSAVPLGVSWMASGQLGSVGSGAVLTGSATYLAYYPALGTVVDDAPVSMTTGNGVAPFNVSILTSNAATSSSGDIFIIASNAGMYLRVNSSGSLYSVQLGLIG